MNMHEEVTIYEPDKSIKRGYINIFPEIIKEIFDNRWLTLQLFRRDFTAAYKQSMMGIVWAFVIPLVSVATFIVLNRSGIFNIGDLNIPYPIYVVLGIAFWQLFATGLMASSQSLYLAGQMISKINFSKKSLVIAAIGQSFIAFLVQMLLFAILCVVFRFTPHIEMLLLPLIIIPLLCFVLALGFVLSLINGIMRDVSNILPMFLTFGMFLTPVLYSRPTHGFLKYVTDINPMYYFISSARDLAFMGRIDNPTGIIVVSIITLFLLLAALVIFHLTETRITERI